MTFPQKNSTFISNHEIIKEWHPTKNVGLDPAVITVGSNKVVWWKCKKIDSHEWESSIYSKKAGRCPICTNRLIIAGVNDLATISPNIALEWHPTLNETLLPSDVGPASHTKVWWKCNKNSMHYWKATVKSRAAGTSCGMCRMLFVVHGVNDLSVTNPNLYKELHIDLNETNKINQYNLAPQSNKKVWWKCNSESSHFWLATVNSRVRGNDCPQCKPTTLIYKVNDLSVRYPEIYKEIHPIRNIEKFTEDNPLASWSNRKIWWKCSKNEFHYWFAAVSSRVSGSGCAMCSGHYIVSKINDLSVLNPELYAQLHPILNSINKIDTSSLAPFTAKKVWWQCKENANHYWLASVHHTARDRGCSMCSGKFIVHGINDLSVKYPHIYKEVHPTLNLKVDSTTISSGSNTRLWWLGNCGHEWVSTPWKRTSGIGCPYCENKKVLVGFNDLKTTNLSLSKEWNYSKNQGLKPDDFTCGSSVSVWWVCSEKHEWKTSINNRNRGTKCPLCMQAQTSKIQQAFHRELIKAIPDMQCDVRVPVKFKTRSSMVVDMLSESLKLVVEYDGCYYHSGGRSGQSLASHMAHDREKTQALVDAGYKVVRIRENGLTHLGMNTDKVLEQDYRYGEPMEKIVKEIWKLN